MGYAARPGHDAQWSGVGTAHAAYLGDAAKGPSMNDNFLTMTGNVTADPVIRDGNSGPFATFRMASTPRRFDARSQMWVDGPTTFVSVIAFNALAANIGASINKGDPVVVHGRMRLTTWGDQERPVTSLEIQATTVGHNLAFGQAKFARVARVTGVLDPLSDPAVEAQRRALAAADAAAELDGPEFAVPSTTEPTETDAWTPFEATSDPETDDFLVRQAG